MARSGVASRRKSEEIILEGRVRINGEIVEDLGTKVDVDRDQVEVDGRRISLEEDKVYIILNKPVGYTTTLKDKYSEKKVIDLIEGIEERIYPIGRLDQDTEGLLLLSNDGDLTYKLTHPSFEVKKTYLALVEGIPEENKLENFRSGLEIDGQVTWEAGVEIVKIKNKNALLKITIHEGRNRQVRKMCEAIGHAVIDLKRVSLGELTLDGIDIGKWRKLTREEVELLEGQVAYEE